jgi:hypothetical protein
MSCSTIEETAETPVSVGIQDELEAGIYRIAERTLTDIADKNGRSKSVV